MRGVNIRLQGMAEVRRLRVDTSCDGLSVALLIPFDTEGPTGKSTKIAYRKAEDDEKHFDDRLRAHRTR